MPVSSHSASASVPAPRHGLPKDSGALIAAVVASQCGGIRSRQVSASANVLVCGQATSQTGVAVSIRAERVFGLYTDTGAGQGPWTRMDGTAWADKVSILADRVENVNTAGGSDSVSILAHRAEGIRTGNDANSLAIVADVVRNILTDGQGIRGDRDATDAGAIAARLVQPVATRGRNDAIAIPGGTVGLFHALGDDRVTLRLGEGSTIFAGLANSGATGLRQGSGAVMQLHPGRGGTLDLSV